MDFPIPEGPVTKRGEGDSTIKCKTFKKICNKNTDQHLLTASFINLNQLISKNVSQSLPPASFYCIFHVNILYPTSDTHLYLHLTSPEET